MKKTLSTVAAIIFFAVGVWVLFKFGNSWFGWEVSILLSILPFGLSVLFLMIGKKTGGKATNDAEMSLKALRDKGLLSEDEYQKKLKMSRSNIQKSMDDLKSLKEAGIITEEEYQQKIDQLSK